MNNIYDGLSLLFQPLPLSFLVVGLIAGFVVGVLPGFDAANAAALALPFSIALPTESALLLIVGIYAGSQFAGAVPAILMNVPGTAGAAATALDGYPMAQQGKGALAIGIARMASTLGGVIASLLVLAVLGPMAGISLSFQSPEMFLVALVGLIIIGAVIGDDIKKGLVSAFIGLLIAAMSASPVTAQPRFTLGFLELYEEVPFVPVVIGVFGFAQMFILARESKDDTSAALTSDGLTSTEDERGNGKDNASGARVFSDMFRQAWAGVIITLKYPRDVVRSSFIGTIIGVIPGMGTTVANFISYGQARRQSKHPERFGKGTPEGVIASEACDNAVSAGTLVPTLTLGIPGSATTAIMLAALYLQGIQPGPRLMESHAAESYAVILGMLLASLLILPIGTILAAPMASITRVPSAVLVPLILLIGVVGSFAMRSSLFDVALALIFGVVGLAMRLHGYPVVPLILGLILGPIAESNLMRALTLSDNDPSILFSSPTTLILWGLLVVALLIKLIGHIRSRSRNQDASNVRV